MPSGIYLRKTLEQRFWEKVVIRGPDDCWEWTGAKPAHKNSGYGHMWVGFAKKPLKATHILFYLRHGYWPPKGRTANHHCDNPGCLNSRHLYLGTQKSNMCDKVKRGRSNKGKSFTIGERNGSAKLTEIEVKEIRQLVKRGISQRELGRRFAVHNRTIDKIVHCKNWAHVK